MRHWWAPRTSNTMDPSNISDLTPKPVRTIAYKWFFCVQIAYKLKGENVGFNLEGV